MNIPLTHYLTQLPGFHTGRRIVVIESDDWGSIRMPSRTVRDRLTREGFTIDRCAFSTYDCLASSDDLEALFDVLTSVKDSRGRYAVVTANAVTCNPDFERIKADHYEHYYSEPFTETLKRYPASHRLSFRLWQQGIKLGIFHPELHGREHLNVTRWLTALQAGDPVTRMSFDQQHFGLSDKTTDRLRVRYMDAFCNTSAESQATEKEIIEQATALFTELFGYRPASFIAPCYIWRDSLEQSLADNGITQIQGLSLQQIPVSTDPVQVKTRFHYTGQRNLLGQHYTVRNAFFEPYKDNTSDRWTAECLRRIAVAFRMRKPAVISSHRINFIGSIEPEFRDRNLQLFRELLLGIVKQWPDVEFMSSRELGELIENGE